VSRLSWNEIRVRAQAFADEWKDARYERGETHSFYDQFFDIFGISRKRVASYEEPVKKLGDKQGFIDLFWKGVLIVEQKSAGRNLANARQQAFDYFPGLKDYELPRYLLACDFQTFELYDLVDNEQVSFKLADLPKHIDKFAFILGVQKRTFKDQDPVNIKASVLMGRLHDQLLQSGYRGHDLERFLVRLLFCLFADDTGIFEPRDMFDELIRTRTKEDGSDVGPILSLLFQTLDTDEKDREIALDEDIAKFPHINGALFKENLRLPSFDSKMRKLLLDACEFSWDAISPAIFGALFQHVSGDAAARRAHGEHYTTENHIMRLIGPLFLDDLKTELAAIKQKKQTAVRERELKGFCAKLASLKFFDPACGCGNFLIIAYREVRLLEIEATIELYKEKTFVLDIEHLAGVDVNQFYGIEINEFPARIAEVAMWMMDHIMNNRLSLALTENFARIPLKKSPSIIHADALEIDWKSVLEPSECSFVFGNPPFLGAKEQSELQRHQVRELASLGKSGGTLDFVCAWYFKAGEYVSGANCRIAFVSTNSISQGEQVAQLWPSMFSRYGLEIAFAHRTFEWSSDARGMAHVHVVIVGLTPRKAEPELKRLFSYPDIKALPVESSHRKLSPYLIDASLLNNPHLVVKESSTPLNGAPRSATGVQPIDGGHFILSDSERADLLALSPDISEYLHPYIGATEFLYGGRRWILMLQTASPALIRENPSIRQRINKVQEFRRQSRRRSTKVLADTPTMFQLNNAPKSRFLVLPEVTSERREYMPIGFEAPPVVPSNLVRIVENATLWEFGVLTSQMHMAWMRTVAGRLKSDYRYSIGVVYNNFPWPIASEKQRQQIEGLAQAVLDARAVHSSSSLADLYDTLAMPVNLRKAHQALDLAVDKLYSTGGFKSDAERVAHLFGLYERMTSLFAQETPTRKKRAKKSD